MAKLVDRITKVVMPLLRSGEKLRVVGQLQSGPLGLMSSFMLLGIFSFFTNKFWYAGITNQHLVLILH